MKAIKDCEWEVKIVRLPKSQSYGWEADTEDDLGINNNGKWESQGFQSEKEAIKKDWILFAALNGITNYKFVE